MFFSGQKKMILMDALLRKNYSGRTPVWFMRQAGRYIPEYLRIKERYKNMLDMIEDPYIATEISLMPIKMFDLDAAIVFSDILVVLKAMGVEVNFSPGYGPSLAYDSLEHFIKFNIDNDFSWISGVGSTLKTIRMLKDELDRDRPVIGFVGAPFTLACYLLDRGKTTGFHNTRELLSRNRDLFVKLIDLLTNVVGIFLIEQIKNGADVVQIFDSHCGSLGEEDFYNFSIKPTRVIVELIRRSYNTPIIGFPRCAGVKYIDYIDNTMVNCVTVDSTVPLRWISDNLKDRVSVQGNLEPFYMSYDLKRAEKDTNEILNQLSSPGFIFNLGHGILPSTPVDNVRAIVDLIKSRQMLYV